MKHKKEAADALVKADPSAPKSKPLVQGISNTTLAIIVGAIVFIILSCCAFFLIRNYQNKAPEPVYSAPPAREVYREPEPINYSPPPVQAAPVSPGSLGGTMVTIAPSSPRTEIAPSPVSRPVVQTAPVVTTRVQTVGVPTTYSSMQAAPVSPNSAGSIQYRQPGQPVQPFQTVQPGQPGQPIQRSISGSRIVQ